MSGCNFVVMLYKLIASRASTRSTQSTVRHYISNLTLNFDIFLISVTQNIVYSMDESNTKIRLFTTKPNRNRMRNCGNSVKENQFNDLQRASRNRIKSGTFDTTNEEYSMQASQ